MEGEEGEYFGKENVRPGGDEPVYFSSEEEEGEAETMRLTSLISGDQPMREIQRTPPRRERPFRSVRLAEEEESGSYIESEEEEPAFDFPGLVPNPSVKPVSKKTKKKSDKFDVKTVVANLIEEGKDVFVIKFPNILKEHIPIDSGTMGHLKRYAPDDYNRIVNLYGVHGVKDKNGKPMTNLIPGRLEVWNEEKGKWQYKVYFAYKMVKTTMFKKFKKTDGWKAVYMAFNFADFDYKKSRVIEKVDHGEILKQAKSFANQFPSNLNDLVALLPLTIETYYPHTEGKLKKADEHYLELALISTFLQGRLIDEDEPYVTAHFSITVDPRLEWKGTGAVVTKDYVRVNEKYSVKHGKDESFDIRKLR